MIEVTLLGTGSPVPDAHRAGPSTLVRAGHQTLLIDCGRGVQQRMAGAETSATALTALLLTHLHSDHIADLGDLLITRWISNFDPQLPPLPIIGPPGTAEVVSATLRAFGHDIGYRMKHHADLTTPPQVDVKEATEGVVWDVDGASVVLAGDTVPCESLDELAAGAGAMVHTVIRKELIAQLPQQRIREICEYHSSPQEAGATAERAGVGILILTHYLPPVQPGQEDEWRAQAATTFSRQIEVGDDLHRVQVHPGVGSARFGTSP